MLAVVYGFSGLDLADAQDLGEVELGGCVITGAEPEWRCQGCGHSWPSEPAAVAAAREDGMRAFGEGRTLPSHLSEDERKAWREGWESRAERFQGTMDELRWHDNGGDPGAT